jgi:hypothetical protein
MRALSFGYFVNFRNFMNMQIYEFIQGISETSLTKYALNAHQAHFLRLPVHHFARDVRSIKSPPLHPLNALFAQLDICPTPYPHPVPFVIWVTSNLPRHAQSRAALPVHQIQLPLLLILSRVHSVSQIHG